METQLAEKPRINPLVKFMNNSTSSGIVLFAAAVIALVVVNTPLAESFNGIWQTKFSLGFGGFSISKPLLLWINDGLMSMFFFVVGLELKREIVMGELSNPRNAVLPFVAGLGGMLVPALIYAAFNTGMDAEKLNGWGIPMATDIAFALGVLYLLGDKVPLSLKVFLTALAIIDDLGAVLVIAFFYTSEISFTNLGIGFLFLLAMFAGNRLGVRNSLFYGILGISGLWLAFLLSGVHATIAAVLAAFTIPATIKIPKERYIAKTNALLTRFDEAPTSEKALLTAEQQAVLDQIKETTSAAISPLQKLEHALHTMVAFLVMPVFALANAGITFSGSITEALLSPVTMGVMAGLLVGKVAGILGFVYLFDKIKILSLPKVLNYRLLTGAAFLAAIGFTMSLFITSLAFTSETYTYQAKIGILLASLVAGLAGDFILKTAPYPEGAEGSV